MPRSVFPKSSLDATVQMLAALAQDTRLKAFRLLMSNCEKGLAAGELARALDVAPNNLSVHLGVLCQAGLVRVRRQGRFQIYTAQIDAVNALLASLVETCCDGHPDVCRLVDGKGRR